MLPFLKRAAAVAAATVVVAGALAAPATATEVVMHTHQSTCTGPTPLPAPPAGPWVRSVEICGPNADVYVIEVIPDTACNCWGVFTPQVRARYGAVYARFRVDGTTVTQPLPVPPSPAPIDSGPPVCLYTNDPRAPYYPCLLVV